MQKSTAGHPSDRYPLPISPLWRSFAEAVGAILALVAFGLCWAGIESLSRVPEPEMASPAWVRPVWVRANHPSGAESRHLSDVRLGSPSNSGPVGGQRRIEARPLNDWSRPVAHVSSLGDAALAPDNFALNAWGFGADSR